MMRVNNALTLLGSRLEAEILLAQVLSISRTALIARSQEALSATEQQAYESLIKRRLAGEPIAYITGFKEFWSLSFVVTPAVLIPRPETEHLVEAVLAKFSDLDSEIQVLELGTGSGAIAIALALERPRWKIVAVDKSKAALEIATKNAKRLITNTHFAIDFYLSDWFSGLPRSSRQFDVIVSNPPYIAPDDIHLKQLDLQYEPQEALVSKPDALQEIRQIVAEAPHHLKSKAWLMLEHGHEQGHLVRDLMHKKRYQEIKTIRDLSGIDRITIGRRP